VSSMYHTSGMPVLYRYNVRRAGTLVFESKSLVEGVSPPIITPLITFSEEFPAIEELTIENLHLISIGLTKLFYLEILYHVT